MVVNGVELLFVAGRQIPLVLVRNPRARRYVLRLRADFAIAETWLKLHSTVLE
jgi:hypothetical protein